MDFQFTYADAFFDPYLNNGLGSILQDRTTPIFTPSEVEAMRSGDYFDPAIYGQANLDRLKASLAAEPGANGFWAWFGDGVGNTLDWTGSTLGSAAGSFTSALFSSSVVGKLLILGVLAFAAYKGWQVWRAVA